MSEKSIERIIDIDIAIIGAGPAGVAAATELSKLGHADNMILFDRENRIAMTSRHCDHQGFGILEFYRPMSGSEYADRLTQEIQKHNISVKLKHSLTKIDNNILTFSTPDGEVSYRARRILFALGAREATRPQLLASGGRSPNIITTGALQRFVHIHHRKPFDKAVIIGSEIVSFSAIMTAKEAGIKIAAIIEQDNRIHSFGTLKHISNYILKVPIYTSSKLISINTEDKEVKSVTVSKNGKEESIECDGVIFSGNFIPESALLHKYLKDFNLQNKSLNTTQCFQTSDERFFLAGNVIRGALTAFNCYFEGKKAAQNIHRSLQKTGNPKTVKIEADPTIGWFYPSLIDIDAEKNILTKIRFHKHTKGLLRVMLNGKEVMRQTINAKPYLSITLDWFNIDIKAGDRVHLLFENSDL